MRYAIFKDHKRWFVYDNHTKKILPTPYNTKAEARAAARSLEEREDREEIFERAVAINAQTAKEKRAHDCRRHVYVGQGI